MAPTMDEFDEFDSTTATMPTQGGNGIDQSYLEQFEGGTGDEISERRVAPPPVPGGTYLVKAISAFGMVSKDGNPYARPKVQIIEGVADTSGRFITDSGGIYFVSKRESKVNGQEVILEGSPKDKTSPFGKKVEARHRMLNRIKAVLGLQTSAPNPHLPAEDGSQEYANQINDSCPMFLIDIRVEKGRNKLVWESIEALDGPVKDSHGNVIQGKTAVEVFRTELAKKNAAPAAGGRRGRNAGAVGRPSTPTRY